MKHYTTVTSVWAGSIGVGLSVILFLGQLGCAAQETRQDIALRPYDFAYQSYARLLQEQVRDGLVNYDGIKRSRAQLDSLVSDLEHADLTAATPDQRLAFYCNAYNILTLRSIVDAYPVNSIKDIDGVWDKQVWLVAGEQLTLNGIEHQILRKEFREPRIHVAINCASIGCPPLLDVPYYPDHLDSLLTVSARRFAASSEHNRIDSVKQVARLSAVFDWFGEDFESQYYEPGKFSDLDKKKSAALNFVIRHLPGEVAAKVSNSRYAVEYLEYDWTLNDLGP